MARSITIARLNASLPLIALLALAGCVDEDRPGSYYGDDPYYGGYEYRSDYRSGYRPDEYNYRSKEHSRERE
jgi:hypothetical protein